MKKLLILSIILLTALTSLKAQACDICAVFVAAEAREEYGKGLHTGVAEQFTHYGTLQQDGVEIFDPANQYMDSSITQVFAGYNFWEGLGLQVNLPIITRHYQRPTEFGIEKGDESGIGDLAALLRYGMMLPIGPELSFSWNAFAGAKFPTGNTSRLQEELGEHHHDEGEEEEHEHATPESGIHGHDLALGSGSYDGLFGAFGRIGWKRIFCTAAFQYALRTRGSYGYRYADDLTWNGGPGVYLLLSDFYSLSLQALTSGEHKGLDDLNGQLANDTGITSVYLGPEIALTLKKILALSLGADLPILQDNTALQIVPDYRIRLGLTLTIPVLK